MGEGSEAQEGAVICIIRADLLSCMTEPTQQCKAIFIQLRKKKCN